MLAFFSKLLEKSVISVIITISIETSIETQERAIRNNAREKEDYPEEERDKSIVVRYPQ